MALGGEAARSTTSSCSARTEPPNDQPPLAPRRRPEPPGRAAPATQHGSRGAETLRWYCICSLARRLSQISAPRHSREPVFAEGSCN